MQKAILDVAAFHLACDVPTKNEPAFPSIERQDLRLSLIEEEFEELEAAMVEQDINATADALADLIYVVIGTALEFGIPLEAVWDEVQRANMAKVDPVTGKVRRRLDGKILKPEGWQPPDIKAVLRGEKR